MYYICGLPRLYNALWIRVDSILLLNLMHRGIGPSYGIQIQWGPHTRHSFSIFELKIPDLYIVFCEDIKHQIPLSIQI
jgi:hypothetical protein